MHFCVSSQVVVPYGGLEEFEKFQEQYATNERLNSNYRNGRGPAGVHGFYMYTWAAHGMDKVGKVFVVGASRALLFCFSTICLRSWSVLSFRGDGCASVCRFCQRHARHMQRSLG